MEYVGLCEASTGAFIDAKHFAVASDETNRIQIYERGNPQPIGNGADMEAFTSFKKSDLEAAAAIGDRIYWISSHSLNSKGKDNDKRKVFFATTVSVANGKPTLVGAGNPIKSLRDPLIKAAGVKASELNIEAMAATPEGELLIGLRNTRADGRALVIPFKNPAAVVNDGAQPQFGPVEAVDLGGRGIRSMELLGYGTSKYILIAGPVSDSADGFAVFFWDGPGTDRREVKGIDFQGLKPEGAMRVPGQESVQLLSDDGDICSDEDDP